jgi:hypothetical protein
MSLEGRVAKLEGQVKQLQKEIAELHKIRRPQQLIPIDPDPKPRVVPVK